jgi:hypothetical protein
MSIGTLFFAIALIFFFLAGIPQTVIAYGPCISWGLFCLTLGLLLNGVRINQVIRQ